MAMGNFLSILNKRKMKNYYILILSLFFAINLQAQCTADYLYVKDSTSVHFVDSSDADGNYICTYSWDFGDGDNSLEQNPVHNYDSAGTYTVCLEIFTASDSSCSDTVCIDSICKNITVKNNCYLQINYQAVNASEKGVCDGSISVSVENGEQEYEYNWNTGDTLNNINGLCAGEYSLTVKDAQSCIDSIMIKILEPDTFIRGVVYVKDNLLPEGMMLLINSNNIVIDKTPIFQGTFAFKSLPDNENYQLYAIPYFDVEQEYYPQYFPTYVGDVVYWQSANFITKDTLQSIDIHLKYYNDIIHGSAFLSGTVAYDNNAAFEATIYNQDWFGNFSGACQANLAANTTVLLIDENNQILKSCLTDNNGFYQFAHLPIQNYKVYVEKNGKEMQRISVNLTNKNDSISNLNFTIKSNIVAEIKNKSNLKEYIQFMPNPFNDYLSIKSKSLVIIKKLEIRDLQSRLIYSQEKYSSNIQINTENFNKGVYFIRLWISDRVVLTKKIIKY